MHLIIAIGLAAAGGVLGVSIWVAARRRKYSRYLKYDPRQDWQADLAGPLVRRVAVHCTSQGFVLPELASAAASAFLEIEIHGSLLGRVADPYLDLTARDFCDQQFFERGASGRRYLNITRLVASAGVGCDVQLRGRYMTWPEQETTIHLCNERPLTDDRVMIVAPHPDDAEIAAFGLYSDTDATVVTLTAGNSSDRFGDDARLRVWDSLTIPQLGGVKPERAVNLCYPDGQLTAMHATPEREFGTKGDASDLALLRQMNTSPVIRHKVAVTWESLVEDLARLFAETRPTLIATPHPWLDPHPDHQFATVAVCQAIRASGLWSGRFYFYLVHNRSTELWPFGPAGSGVPLLPLPAQDLVDCDGFYSHPLSLARERQKFLALEAMHDVREITVPDASFRAHLLRMHMEARAALHGLGLRPTSYLRRAVRPDEIFFTASFQRGIELCDKLVPCSLEAKA